MANLITGNDGSNTLQGTAGVDVIYGYNPDGPQSNASTIAATRVASALNQPLFAGAPPGDPGRLFIVEKTSSAATTPTRPPATSTATACPTSCGKAATARRRSG